MWEAIRAHRRHLIDSGELNARRAERLEKDIRRALVDELVHRAEAGSGDGVIRQLRDDVIARRLDPWAAARRLADHVRR